MKKTIKRGHAIVMYESLNRLAIGGLEEKMLEAVMDNLINLEKHATHFEKMMKELGKRLYEGVEQERIEEFNAKIQTAQKFVDIEKKVAAIEVVKDKYPDLFDLLAKQMKVEASLKDKDVEVELEIVDKREFSKAVVKANQDLSLATMELFEPMYEKEEVEEKEEDFSELDELLK